MRTGIDFKGILSVKHQSQLLDPENITAVIYRNDVKTTLPITITKLELGIYSYSFLVPTDWVQDDRVSLLVQFDTRDFTGLTALKFVGVVESSEDSTSDWLYRWAKADEEIRENTYVRKDSETGEILLEKKITRLNTLEMDIEDVDS